VSAELLLTLEVLTDQSLVDCLALRLGISIEEHYTIGWGHSTTRVCGPASFCAFWISTLPDRQWWIASIKVYSRKFGMTPQVTTLCHLNWNFSTSNNLIWVKRPSTWTFSGQNVAFFVKHLETLVYFFEAQSCSSKSSGGDERVAQGQHKINE